MAQLLTSFGSSANGVSWYVDYDFKRPQITKDWEPIVRESLKAFEAGQVQAAKSVIEVDENFRISLYRREPTSGPIPGEEDCFTLIGYMDFDTTTFPDADVPEVLAIAVTEKTTKRRKALLKYPSIQSYSEWWLVLVDYIAAGTQRSIAMKHDWDKVMIIFPKEYERAYEVLNSN